MIVMLAGLRVLRLTLGLYATGILLLVASDAYHPLMLCALAEYVAARILSHADPMFVAVALIALSSAVCVAMVSILIRGTRFLVTKRSVSL